MVKSKIYKELTEEQLSEIVKDLYGTEAEITHYSILKGGLFNTTYYLITDKDDKGVVLRVAPVNKHLLFEFEKDMMGAEPFFHDLLQKNNIPTTRILKHVPQGVVIDREYIISEYMNSIPMNDPSLSNTDLSVVYKEVGFYARRMHTITNDKFGWKRKDGWGEYDKWSEFVLAFAKEAADKAKEHNLFKKYEIEKFEEIFNNSVHILDEISIPYMTHTDLWQGNILLRYCDGRYNVAAIIDLDRTIFGDKYWDLSNPWMINNAFLIGYGENTPETENHIRRCNMYKLLAGFFGAYVVLIEYVDYKWFEREKGNAKLLLEKL